MKFQLSVIALVAAALFVPPNARAQSADDATDQLIGAIEEQVAENALEDEDFDCEAVEPEDTLSFGANPKLVKLLKKGPVKTLFSRGFGYKLNLDEIAEGAYDIACSDLGDPQDGEFPEEGEFPGDEFPGGEFPSGGEGPFPGGPAF